MVNRKKNFVSEIKDTMRGGEGSVLFTDLTNGIKPINIRIFAELKLLQGCSIGEHMHENETELFYIMSGEGVYNDNGQQVTVSAGDVCICQSGEKHSVMNKSSEPLIILAAIIFN